MIAAGKPGGSVQSFYRRRRHLRQSLRFIHHNELPGLRIAGRRSQPGHFNALLDLLPLQFIYCKLSGAVSRFYPFRKIHGSPHHILKVAVPQDEWKVKSKEIRNIVDIIYGKKYIGISEFDDMIKKTEKIFKALSEKNRLRIVNMLMAKPMCVCEITDVLDLSQSTVSGHLRILKEADIIEDTKEGLWVEYSLVKREDINKSIFRLLRTMFEEDQALIGEKRSALTTDRKILCKK